MVPSIKCVAALLLLSIALPGLAGPPDASAEDAAVIAQILKDWKARWERLERVSYTLEGTRAWMPGSLSGAPDDPTRIFPKEPESGPVVRKLDIDFRNGRVRHESEFEVLHFGEMALQYSVLNCDGRELVKFRPKDRQPPIPRSHVRAEILYEPNVEFFQGIRPILFAHGIVRYLPATTDVRAPRSDMETLKLVRREPLDGTLCIVLRGESLPGGGGTAWWVDLKRESAVVRVDLHVKHHPNDATHVLRETTDVAYAQTDHGWLPSGWSKKTWTRLGPPSLLFAEEVRLTEFSANPPLSIERFQVQLKPGMVFKRRGQPGTWVEQGKGLPPIEAREYWIKKGWWRDPNPNKRREEA